eukprot:2698232-Amphidinium_carterae.1
MFNDVQSLVSQARPSLWETSSEDVGGRMAGGEGIPDFDELLSFAGLEGDLADLPESAPLVTEDAERHPHIDHC